ALETAQVPFTFNSQMPDDHVDRVRLREGPPPTRSSEQAEPNQPLAAAVGREPQLRQMVGRIQMRGERAAARRACAVHRTRATHRAPARLVGTKPSRSIEFLNRRSQVLLRYPACRPHKANQSAAIPVYFFVWTLRMLGESVQGSPHHLQCLTTGAAA